MDDSKIQMFKKIGTIINEFDNHLESFNNSVNIFLEKMNKLKNANPELSEYFDFDEVIKKIKKRIPRSLPNKIDIAMWGFGSRKYESLENSNQKQKTPSSQG